MDGQGGLHSSPAGQLDQRQTVGSFGGVLAGREQRLMAKLIDGFLLSIAWLPSLPFVWDLYSGAYRMPEGISILDLPSGGRLLHRMGATLLIGLLGSLGILVYQWTLITRRGQTLGKKWAEIRIERVDRERMTFGTGVALRNWLPKVLGAIPFVGQVFLLVDWLSIFREDCRCLHDHLAGTRVVRVPASGPAGDGV